MLLDISNVQKSLNQNYKNINLNWNNMLPMDESFIDRHNARLGTFCINKAA